MFKSWHSSLTSHIPEGSQLVITSSTLFTIGKRVISVTPPWCERVITPAAERHWNIIQEHAQSGFLFKKLISWCFLIFMTSFFSPEHVLQVKVWTAPWIQQTNQTLLQISVTLNVCLGQGQLVHQDQRNAHLRDETSGGWEWSRKNRTVGLELSFIYLFICYLFTCSMSSSSWNPNFMQSDAACQENKPFSQTLLNNILKYLTF